MKPPSVIVPVLGLDRIRSVRLLPWRDDSGVAYRCPLTRQEADALHLDEVTRALVCLELPSIVAADWSVAWDEDTKPLLNGRSAQCAALITVLLDAAARNGSQLPPWMNGVDELWAFGQVALSADPPVAPLLLPVLDQHNELDSVVRQKLAAFCQSSAPLLIAPAADVSLLSDDEWACSGVAVYKNAVPEPHGETKGSVGHRTVVAIEPDWLEPFIRAKLIGQPLRVWHAAIERFPRIEYGTYILTTIAQAPLGLFAGWFSLVGNFSLALPCYAFGLLADTLYRFTAKRFHLPASMSRITSDFFFLQFSSLCLFIGALLFWDSDFSEKSLTVLIGLGALYHYKMDPVHATPSHVATLCRALIVAFLVRRLDWQEIRPFDLIPYFVATTFMVALAVAAPKRAELRKDFE